MKQTLLTLLAFMLVITGFSQTTYTSVKDGAWTDITTWSPQAVPQTADHVVIRVEDTVTTGALTRNAGGTTTVNGGLLCTGNVTATPVLMTVNGTLDLNYNSPTAPQATWATTSTIKITGVTTGGSVGQMSQNFGNVVWNNTAQTVTSSMALTASVNWTSFTLSGSNTKYVRFTSTTGLTITIAGALTVAAAGDTLQGTGSGIASVNFSLGSLSLSGGTFYPVASGAASTVSITNDFSLSNNASYNKGSGPVTTLIGGNFSMAGTSNLTNGGSGTDSIAFVKAGTATFTKASTANITNAVKFGVASGCTLDFGTSVLNATSTSTNFTLHAGAGIITANTTNSTGALTLTGSNGTIQVAGTRTYSPLANYTFNGSSAQYTGNALTAANNLTFTNPTTVSFTNPTVSVSGNLSVTTGSLQQINGVGTTITFTGAASTLSVGGAINGTNVGPGNDISLSTATGSTVSVTGAGSLVRFLNTTVAAGSILDLKRGLEVMFGTFATNGTLRLSAGGFISGSVSPTYGTSAALVYNAGTLYGRGLEWTEATSGAGYPNDVQVTGNTTLNYPNGVVAARSIARDLIIDLGSALYMDYGGGTNNAALSIGRSVVLSGDLSLGNAIGGDLFLKGDWTHSSGNFYPNARAVTFLGTTDQTISSSLPETFAFLISNKTSGNLILNSKVFIVDEYIPVAGQLLSNGNLVIKSVSGKTGRIASGAGTISGSVTMQRYIPGGRRAFRYVGHPFNGAIDLTKVKDSIYVTGPGGPANGFDDNGSPYNASAYYWDSAQAQPANQAAAWVAYPTITTPWNKYQGIALFVRGDRTQPLNGTPTPNPVTLAISGAVNQGQQTIQLYKATNTNFNLVGNPYPSPVNLKTTTRGPAVGSAFYLWDPNRGTQGAYRTNSFAAQDYILPSLAAFFVEATSNTLVDNTITFNETDKSATDTSTLFRTANTAQHLFLQAESGSVIWDDLQLFFNNGSVAAKEFADATKFFNPEVNLYSISSDNKSLAIDNRPVDQSSVIKLGFAGAAGSYTFRVTGMNLPANLTPYIKDRFNGNSLTALTNGGTFNFTVTSDPASAAYNRFELVFAPQAPLPVTLTNVTAYTKNTGIQVDWTLSSEMNMNKYQVERSSNGIQFNQIGSVASKGNSAVTVNYNLYDAAPLTGANYYRIKMIDNNGQATYSRVVRVVLGKASPSITVYPNPVKEDVISLEMNNLATGNYNVTLTNKLGQEVYTSVISHNNSSSTETLNVGNIQTGIYQLKVSGAGTVHTTQLLKQ